MDRRPDVSAGQTALELIVAFAVIIMVFSIVVLISMDKTAESSRIKTFLDARRVAGSIRDNINMISQQGPGYYSHFSMPLRLQGDYEYSVYIKGNALELMWGEDTWSTKLTVSNLTVYCLSKGLNVKNRVFYGRDGVGVKCHLPDLTVLPDRFSVDENTVSVDVLNDAHVSSPAFVTSLSDNTTQLNLTVSGLNPDESIVLEFNFTSPPLEYLIVYVDPSDEVNESVETDNNFTMYL